MHPTASNRLYFLDWLRIIAFFVLIFYHVGMYYVSWDWHVKSPFASSAIEPLMLMSSPWRLGLLFLISGVASSFMLGKLSAPRFMRERSWRLLVPLLFGMAVIVPPQPFFEVVEKGVFCMSSGQDCGPEGVGMGKTWGEGSCRAVQRHATGVPREVQP